MFIAGGSGIPERGDSRYHRNVRVEGNTFRVFDPRIINVYCVDGFSFTADNKVEFTRDYPYTRGETRCIITDDCDHVNVEKEVVYEP